MDELQNFIKNYIGLAGFMSLSEDNPVKFEIEEGDNIFMLYVSHNEPTFAKTPYNVLWIPADPASPDHSKLLRRTDHSPDGAYDATWEEVTEYSDRFSQVQYWEPVVEDLAAAGIDPISISVAKATTTELGIVRLTSVSGGSAAVETTDPRMSDDRQPTEHDHPDYPRSMIRINDTQYAIVKGAPTEAGQLLFLTKDNGDNTFDAEWRKPTESDVNWSVPSLDSVSVALPPSRTYLEDFAQFHMQAAAHWSDGTVEPNPANVTWSVGANSAGISIDNDGVIDIPDLPADYSVSVYADIVDPASSNPVRGSLRVQVRDLYTPTAALTGLEIIGATSIWENGNADYTVRATFSDGSQTLITPDSFTVAGAAGALTGMNLAGTDVSADTTVVLTAEYTAGGVTLSDTHDVLIKDNPPTTLTIVGSTSVPEGDEAIYAVSVDYADGTNRQLTVAELDEASLKSDSASFVMTGYTGQAQAVTTDTLVQLSASFTEGGVTVSDTHDLTVVNSAKVLASIAIVGNDSVREGEQATYLVRATYDDGTTNDIIPNSFSMEDSVHASLSGMVLTANLVDANQSVTLNASYTYEGVTKTATKSVTITDATMIAITLEGDKTVLPERGSMTLNVVAEYDDGSTKSIPFAALNSLTANKPDVTLTGYDVEAGTVEDDVVVTFTAEYTEAGVTLSDTFAVLLQNAGPEVASLVIVGDNSIYENEVTDYDIRVTFSDASEQLISGTDARITWTKTGDAGTLSGNELSGTDVSADTVVTLKADFADVSGSASNTLDVTIADVVLVSVAINGATTMTEGSTESFTAQATYNDGSTKNVTLASFVSDTADVVTFSGMDVTALDVDGDQAIVLTGEYTEGGVTVSDTHNLTVEDLTATLTGLDVTGPGRDVPEGGTLQLKAEALYDDTSRVVVTDHADIVWSVVSGPVTVDGGLVTGNSISGGDQAAVVRADFQGQSDTFNVTVKAVTVTSLNLMGAASVDEDTTETYTFEAVFSDGSTIDLAHTDLDSFTTSNAAIATVSGANVTFGNVASDSSVTLTAKFTFEGKQVTATKSVSIADNLVPTSLTIIGDGTIYSGETKSLSFRVNYSDGTNKLVTHSQLATLNKGTGHPITLSGSQVTGNSVSLNTAAQISASYSEKGVTVNDTHDMTVYAIVPTSVTILGPTSIPETEDRAGPYSFTVSLNYGNDIAISLADLDDFTTSLAGTSISGAYVNFGPSIGGNKTTRLTATYTMNGTQASGTLDLVIQDTVKEITSITAIRGPDSVDESLTAQYTIDVVYDDGTTETGVNSDQVVWSVTTGGQYGNFSNSTAGLFQAGAVNGDKSLTIKATTGRLVAVSATKNITIKDTSITLTGLAITPASPAAVDEGGTQQFTATASWSDGSTTDVTSLANWTFTTNSYSSTIVNGLFTAGEVTANRSITIQASHSDGSGNTLTDTVTIGVNDVPTETKIYKWGVAEIPATASAVTEAWVKANLTTDLALVNGDTVAGTQFEYTDGGYVASPATLGFIVLPEDEGFFYFQNIANSFDDTTTYPGYAMWTDGGARPVRVQIDGVWHRVYAPDFQQTAGDGSTITIQIDPAPDSAYPDRDK